MKVLAVKKGNDMYIPQLGIIVPRGFSSEYDYSKFECFTTIVNGNESAVVFNELDEIAPLYKVVVYSLQGNATPKHLFDDLMLEDVSIIRQVTRIR